MLLLSSAAIATAFVGSAAAAATKATTPLVSAPVTLAPPPTVTVTVPTSPISAPVSDPFQPGPAPQPAATAPVSIVDFGFSPATITVAAGTTVTWTNTGSSIHSVTSDTRAFDSSPSCPSGPCIDPGGSFSHLFATAGRFSYHCRVHPGMIGTVVVNAAPPSTTTSTTTATSGNPPVSAGGGGNPTTTAGSTGPQLAFTGTSSTEAWLVLSALFTISIGLALRPRRRAFPIPVPTRRPPDLP